jgi:ATP-dependent Clp protease adaptor protein ClpS
MPTIALPSIETEDDVKESIKRKLLPPWNVVLLDDDDHSYDYVIEMLRRLFGHNVMDAIGMAREVDLTGRVIVLTTHRERAELERDRIHSYGADPRIPRCKGSMSAVIEPACGA